MPPAPQHRTALPAQRLRQGDREDDVIVGDQARGMRGTLPERADHAQAMRVVDQQDPVLGVDRIREGVQWSKIAVDREDAIRHHQRA